jgi:hypothetical protein
MGADGGITWVRVKDRNKFEKLVKPLGLEWHRSNYDEYHYKYLAEHPLPSDYAVATYSNLGGYNDGYRDLQEILDYLSSFDHSDYPKKDNWDTYFRDANPLDYSWEELMLNHLTHPDANSTPGRPCRGALGASGGCYYIPRMVELAWDQHYLFFKNGKIEESWRVRFPGFFEMKLRDWYREVLDVIYPKTIDHRETWT